MKIRCGTEDLFYQKSERLELLLRMTEKRRGAEEPFWRRAVLAEVGVYRG